MTSNNNILLYLQQAQKALNEELKDINSRIELHEASIAKSSSQVLKETNKIIDREKKAQKIKDKIREYEMIIKKTKEENGVSDEDEPYDDDCRLYNGMIESLYDKLYDYEREDNNDDYKIDRNSDIRTNLLNVKLNLTNYKNKCISLLDDIEIKIETNEFEESDKEEIERQLKNLTKEYIENKLKNLNAPSIKHTKIELFLMSH